MPRHLILHLEAPLMSFGGATIDNYGVVEDYPAASMITGLIANSLGWDRSETDRHQRLQDRLVFGARLDRRGTRMTDFQTVQLSADDKGWTTDGRPEGRRGGAETYRSPHLRFRDYDADACVLVALRLDPAEEQPDLEVVAEALTYPARPLFLGRKPCLPSTPLVAGWHEAEDLLAALSSHPALPAPTGAEARRQDRARATGESAMALAFWPPNEGQPNEGQPGESDGGKSDQGEIDPGGARAGHPAREIYVTDRRVWRSGVHGGQRRLLRRELPLPEVAQRPATLTTQTTETRQGAGPTPPLDGSAE